MAENSQRGFCARPETLGGIMTRSGFVAMSVGAILAGCVTVPLAPGADQVRITRNAGDVAGCTPVGNIDRLIVMNTWDDRGVREMQNQAVGLGGNVVFDTTIGNSGAGVIYRCGKAPDPGSR